jgi:hypothetical protein
MSSKTAAIGMFTACGVCMISSFAMGSYTCTGGTFDLGEFNGDTCFAWPEKKTASGGGSGSGSGSGGGGGGGNPASYTGDFPASAHFSKCDGAVAILRECRQSGGNFGVRWNTIMCSEHVAKFGIDVVSSADASKKYRYITANAPGRNSIVISQVPRSFYSGHNITLIVTPLDQYEKKISTGTESVLDSISSYESCSGIGGSPVPFAQFKEVTAERPAPVDCTGGSWSAPGSCMADDGVTILTGEPGKCGAGITKRILSGYTQPKYGGTCKTEEGTRCYVPCPAETPSNCVLAKYPEDHPTRAGQIAWNPASGTPDFNYMCCSVDPKGKVFQSADVLEDAQGTGTCQYTQEISCSCP